MSKRRLVTLILALILIAALACTMMSCNRRKPPQGSDNDTENPTSTPVGESCEHAYDNDCDVDCNKCGEQRLPAAHIYDNDEDTDCNVCGAARELVCEHEYDNACDADCNLCGETRTPAEHVEEAVAAKDATCTEDGLTRGSKCSVCGEILTEQSVISAIGHSYDNSCDETCNVCGEERNPSDHVAETIPGTAATCTQAGLSDGAVCSVCGVTITEQTVVPATGHTFADAWVQGEATHWQKCADCDETHLKADHVYVNACDADCNVCGATRTPADHIYDNACDASCNTCGATRTVGQHDVTVAYDEENHWTVCQSCGAIADVAAHSHENGVCACGHRVDPCEHSYEFACSAECELCGEVRVPADHNFVDKIDQENHWKECTVCSKKKNVQEHTFEKVAVDNERHELICVVCGASNDMEPHTALDGTCGCGWAPSDEE